MTKLHTQHYKQKLEAVNTDILINPALARRDRIKASQMPRRKRRINYAKKIMNDPFIMNV